MKIQTNNVQLTDTIPGYLSLSEAWEQVAKVSDHIVRDNDNEEGDYPTDIRRIQVITLQSLLNLIKQYHDQ